MDARQQTAAPFLNEHKRQFLVARLLQTLLGGMIIKKDSNDFLDDDSKLPWFIYFYQILLFIIPFLIGGTGILISDLTNFTSSLYISIFAGAFYFLYIFILKLISMILYNLKLNKNNSNNSDNKDKLTNKKATNNKRSLLNDSENNYQFKSMCSMSCLTFVIQPVGSYMRFDNGLMRSVDTKKFMIYLLRISIDSLLAGFMMFSCVKFQSILYLQTYFNLAGAVIIFILSWFVLCIGFYSLCIREPHEPAIYQPYDKYKIQHYTRAFYIILFQIIEVIYLGCL